MKRILVCLAALIALVASAATAANYSVTNDIQYDKNFYGASATNATYAKNAAGLVSAANLTSALAQCTGGNGTYLLVVDSLQSADTTAAMEYAMRAPNAHRLGDNAYYIPNSVTVTAKVGSAYPVSTYGIYKPAAEAEVHFDYKVIMQVAEASNGPWSVADASILAGDAVAGGDSIATTLTGAGWYQTSKTTSLTIGGPKYCRFIVQTVAAAEAPDNHKLWFHHLWFTRQFNFND